MNKQYGSSKAAADKLVKNIRRKTRQTYSAEEKIRIVLAGLRGEYYLDREEPDTFNATAHQAWLGAKTRAHNQLEIIVAKQRRGAIGTAHVKCDLALNRIWED